MKKVVPLGMLIKLDTVGVRIKYRNCAGRKLIRPLSTRFAMAELSASGRITRVTTKFAFIKSQKYGGVFVPPCAALPMGSEDGDLTHFLKTGDLVHFTAIAQKGKNDCQYLATRVVLSRNADPQVIDYGAPPLLTPCPEPWKASQELREEVGVIERVTETFGSIHCQTLGPVFFPGSAYKPEDGEPPRLNVVFSPGDIVQFVAIQQLEMNGCHWLAKHVIKMQSAGFQESNSRKDEGLPFGPRRSVTRVSKLYEGVVANLGPLVGLIESKDIGCVTFNMLSWFGDNKEGSAANLFDVVSIGDKVVFKLSGLPRGEGGLVAKEVKEKSNLNSPFVINESISPSLSHSGSQTEPFSVPLVIGPWKNLANAAKKTLDGLEDKETQTVSTPEYLLARGIKSSMDLKEICQSRFPHLMKYTEQGEIDLQPL